MKIMVSAIDVKQDHAHWYARDPVMVLRQTIQDAGIAEQDIRHIEDQIDTLIADAVQAAECDEHPLVCEADKDVFV